METCYRHPNRETGVSCSNCGRPICPDCMTSTPVGMRCPECARQRTKVKTMGSVTEPMLTYVLIAVNVVVALGLVLGGSGGSFGLNPLYQSGALIGSGAALDGTTVGVAHGELWRLLTSGFIHGDGQGGSSVFIHLLFNMFALYVLGGMLEPAVGRLRFGIIYTVSILVGSFGALLLTPDGFTAGASGGVFGLMAAAVVVMRNRGINPMESGLGLWIGLNLLITFTIPGISIGGHIGGLIGGALAAFTMFDLRDRVRMPDYAPLLLLAVLAVVAVVGSVAVSGSSPA